VTSGIQLIVGLGNPGQEYEKTRHNAGAWYVSDLAHTSHISLRHEKKYRGAHAQTKIHGHECHLFIPATFMNVCGQSIAALANYYKIPPHAILVAHDEIDLPVGEIRLKFDGGHGGHNGLRDIISHLNTNKFHRLRIGVGRPTHGQDVADYVLEPPKKTERSIINTTIHDALEITPLVLAGQFQKAMNTLHTK
jgi:peptidyl-tRNA hydrolase, PTH1 family